MLSFPFFLSTKDPIISKRPAIPMRMAPMMVGFQKLQHVRSMTTPIIKGL